MLSIAKTFYLNYLLFYLFDNVTSYIVYTKIVL